MDQIFEIMKQMNIAQLLVIGVMFWIFYNRLNKKIDTLSIEIKWMQEQIHSLNKRLCRIEVILHAQDCCAIKSSNDIRKVEGQ